MVQAQMRRYEASFEMVAEKGAENVDVFKSGALATGNLLPEGRDAAMKVVANRLTVSCNADNKNGAYVWANTTAARFARLISMKTGQHFIAAFTGLDSVPGEAGQGIFNPLHVRFWVETYDVTAFPGDVESAGLATQFDDRVLDTALMYFQRGLFYYRVVWRHIDPRSPDQDFTAAAATLNFHHAVKVILGDDKNGRRSQTLGVDRTLRKRIEQLYRRRSDYGVAHPTFDDGAIHQLRKSLVESQRIAREIIEAYMKLLGEGGTLPAKGRSTGRQRER